MQVKVSEDLDVRRLTFPDKTGEERKERIM